MAQGNNLKTLSLVIYWVMSGTAFISDSVYSSVKIKDLDTILDFPGGAVVRTLPANAGDTGSSPGLGRSHIPRSN